MFISKENNVTTLINVFSVKPENQEKLLKLWEEFTEEMRRTEPGLLGASLHKSKDGTRVINYAQWRSDGDFAAFRTKYPEWFAKLAAVSEVVDPHTYEIVYQYERES
jgi:quinol monooxygenase YgiN